MSFPSRQDNPNRSRNGRSSPAWPKKGIRHRVRNLFTKNAPVSSDIPSVVSLFEVGDSTQDQYQSESSIAGCSRNVLDNVSDSEPSLTSQSFWDRAYDALANENQTLVQDYEKLLKKEIVDASTSNDESPTQPVSLPQAAIPGPVTRFPKEQLDLIIQRGLQRADAAKIKYTIAGHEFNLTDQISQGANFVLWAKDFVAQAVAASPAASISWAGVCLVVPLLTNATTANAANSDGFTYVTTRMRYCAALEPNLLKLLQNDKLDHDKMNALGDRLVDLYKHILDFQLRSVLRFYQSRLKTVAKDTILSTDWKFMKKAIKDSEEEISKDLAQLNDLRAREELESINKASLQSLAVMENYLSVVNQQLNVQTEILRAQQNAEDQKQLDKQMECIRLFRLHNSKQESMYEWHKNRVEDRVEGTCRWVLEQDEYKNWLKQESGLLLVTADPGCGKSVLAKYLVDHVLPGRSASTEPLGDDETPPNPPVVCYFFFKDQDQNMVSQALCAVLHQLFCSRTSLVSHAMKPFEMQGSSLVQSTVSLWEIVKNVLQDPQTGPVIIVLDALDECEEKECENLMCNIDKLSNGYTLKTAKFLFTSRPYKHIMTKFRHVLEKLPCVHIPGEQQLGTIADEVNCVIASRLNQLVIDYELSDEIRTTLQTNFLKIKHRTYLWVHLVFDDLTKKFDEAIIKNTPKGVGEAMQDLPKTVNEAYEQILRRSTDLPVAKTVLGIMLAARRPLLVSEMNVAVNVHSDLCSLEKLDLEKTKDFERCLRTVCGLFISIYHGKVYFLHQTAREFLTSSCPETPSPGISWQGSISLPKAHAILADRCLIYLDTLRGLFRNLPENYASLDVFAFLDYSTKYWAEHLHDADVTDSSILRRAFTISGPPSDFAMQYTMATKYYHFDMKNEILIGLFITSTYGLRGVMILQLERGVNIDVNVKNNNGRTPLMFAASSGHEDVARVLNNDGQTCK